MKQVFWLAMVSLAACGGSGPRTCPEVDGPNCFLFSPKDTGLTGQGATVDHLAMRGSRDRLVVFLNGSGGSPRNGAPVLKAARDVGAYGIAVSYRSDDAVGVMCDGDDHCFEPTRVSLLTGSLQDGASSRLENLKPDEGIEPRLIAALKFLNTFDEAGNWSQFLDGDQLKWSLVIVSGHSQGGGHAALMARRHELKAALMLASPCDALADKSPATWVTSSVDWETPPTRLYGMWGNGDAICPAAPEIYLRLRVREGDTAINCPGTAPHNAPLTCASNVERWSRIFSE